MYKKTTIILALIVGILIAYIFFTQNNKNTNTVLGLDITNIDGGHISTIIYNNTITAGPHNWVEFINNETEIELEDFVQGRFGSCDFDIVPQDNKYQIMCQGPEDIRNYAVRSHTYKGQQYIVIERYQGCTSGECYTIALNPTP